MSALSLHLSTQRGTSLAIRFAPPRCMLLALNFRMAPLDPVQTDVLAALLATLPDKGDR